jgi:hypothetical protein
VPTNQNTTQKPVASLNLPHGVSALIIYAQGIVKALTNNPAIPNPVPTVAALTAAIADLAAAQTATQTRLRGAVTTRNEKKATLLTLLRQLRGNVQAVTFAAKPANVTGSVTLVAPAAAHRASYEWESSADGGTTWVAAAPSLQAKTVVTGLKAGTTVLFRYRPVVKGGAANWSQAVSLLVQ